MNLIHIPVEVKVGKLLELSRLVRIEAGPYFYFFVGLADALIGGNIENLILLKLGLVYEPLEALIVRITEKKVAIAAYSLIHVVDSLFLKLHELGLQVESGLNADSRDHSV